MPRLDDHRIVLRRRTYDINDDLVTLVDALEATEPSAAEAVMRARSALFEAWTILCEHQADDDEDH